MSKLEDKKFTHALYTSMLLHVVAIIIFYFGIPAFREKLPDDQQIFTFEMLPASAIPNVKSQDTKKKGRVEKQAKKIKQSKTPAKKTPPPEIEKKAEKAPKKKVEEKKAAPAKKVIEETKQQSTKKAPDAKKVEKTKTKQAKPEENPMDTLMKNLEEASAGETARSAFRAIDVSDLDDTMFSRGQIYDENSPLSVTERLLVKRQIKQNWRPPIGAEDLEEVRVLLHMKLNEDGSIKELSIKDVICPTMAVSTCTLVKDSAIRAVRKANPLENLLPDRYDIWKEFDLYFDPSQIAQ